MKNVLRSILMAIFAITFVAVAYAQSPQPRWTFDQVLFRSHIAAQVGVDGDPGASDSSYASGIAKFDTTAGVPTNGWTPLAAAGGAVDSLSVARLIIFDAGLASVTLGKTSATAESIYIKTQVSPNNNTWFDCAVIPGQSPVLNAFTVQTTVNAAVITFTASQNTGSSDKMWSLRYVAAQGAAGRKDAVDINNVHQFPYVRWIIMGSRSLNHSYKAVIAHVSTR